MQPGLPTIQGALERIIGEMEGAPVEVAGSGRTDAGVHALAQVAAFSIRNPIPLPNLRKAINRLLPPAIRVLTAEEAPPDFHPRFQALAKTYEYRVFRGAVCPPLEWRYVHHYPYPLNTGQMAGVAPLLEGDHDFTAFAAADASRPPGHTNIRTVHSSRIVLEGERLIYRICGSGFLKHMVRNIMGMLLEAGKENVDAQQVRKLLEPAAGCRAGPTAPAKGLFLVRVEYE